MGEAFPHQCVPLPVFRHQIEYKNFLLLLIQGIPASSSGLARIITGSWSCRRQCETMKYPGLDPPGTEQRHEIILHSLPPVRICVPNLDMVETKKTQPIRSILNKVTRKPGKKKTDQSSLNPAIWQRKGEGSSRETTSSGRRSQHWHVTALCHLVSLVPSRTWTISSSVLFDINRLIKPFQRGSSPL